MFLYGRTHFLVDLFLGFKNLEQFRTSCILTFLFYTKPIFLSFFSVLIPHNVFLLAPDSDTKNLFMRKRFSILQFNFIVILLTVCQIRN